MHVRDLLELATVVASNSAIMLAQGKPLPAASLEAYWSSSKARLDRWGHSLKRFCNRSASAAPRNREISWLVARQVIEEILASEVLTRTWTAFLTASDRHWGLQEAEPIGRSVFVGHLEARHRAMNLLVRDPAIPAEHAVALNRLRHRTERWIDLLIGRMHEAGDCGEFASNRQRSLEFAADLRADEHAAHGRLGWQITMSAMRGSFAEGFEPLAANPDLNAAIANSILAGCGAELFNASGVLQSAWLARLGTASEDTELLIEDLFAMERASAAPTCPGIPPALGRYQQRDRFRS